jgi:hypothetical protein
MNMSQLTHRQRVTVNAALSMIALHGHNPRAVQAVAQKHIVAGAAANKAYTAALEEFTGAVPGIRETLATIIALVSNSDDATLARYDTALSQFNETGDNNELEALGPMIADDFKALLIHNGLATAEEAAGFDFSAAEALGFDDSAVAVEPWAPDLEELTAPEGDIHNEEDDMNPLTPRQYADEVRVLAGRLRGPIEDSPEYAALQQRLTGHVVSSQPGQAVAHVRNGEAFVPGSWGPTGYTSAMTGERAREWAGTPIIDSSMG